MRGNVGNRDMLLQMGTSSTLHSANFVIDGHKAGD